MPRKAQKTVEQYKAELIEHYASAHEVSSFSEPAKNQAMWELLYSGYITPVSPSLWMRTVLASSCTKWPVKEGRL